MSAVDVDQKPQNLSELRMVFARNLSILVEQERSVSEAARNLRISRSQLNRFLSGETYPRPDVLQRICQHFKTDARILTNDLADLTQAGAQLANPDLMPGLFEGLEPVQASVLPDGIYAEWMVSTVQMGMVEMRLIRIFTEDGHRIGKVRISILSVGVGMKRYRYPMVQCRAQYFMQRDGFASIDRVENESFHAFTAFRVGYGPTNGVYPGYKLSGISHHPKRHFSRAACLLQRIGADTKALLVAARTAEFQKFSDAPQLVQQILKDVQEESGMWQAL
jgi:transcriptional regulator with XRE-family HTH domain